jgi:hypothetical protein
MSVEIAAIGVQRPFVLEPLEQEVVVHKVWEAPDRAAALRLVAASVRGAITNAMWGRSADMNEALPNPDQFRDRCKFQIWPHISF